MIWIPIFLWMAHLGSCAALVRYVDLHGSDWWVLWLDTGVCAAGTIACLATSVWLVVDADTPSDSGEPEGRTRFLAWQGVLAGLANLALILTEGSLVAFISRSVR